MKTHARQSFHVNPKVSTELIPTMFLATYAVCPEVKDHGVCGSYVLVTTASVKTLYGS